METVQPSASCVKRTAFANWIGSPEHGTGVITTQSNTLREARYSRLGAPASESGSNSQELLAAAHAACFCTTLSEQFQIAGLCAERIDVTASVTSKSLENGWTVTGILLEVTARVPGISLSDFIDATVRAKTSCPMCRLLNTNVTLSAHLESNTRGPS
jgi:osmotically inducible protein OsmC